MNATDFLSELQRAFAPQLLGILGAIGILVLGWLVAIVGRRLTRRALDALTIDQRLSAWSGRAISLEQAIATGLFWFIILITLIGVFNVVNLQSASAPIATVVDQLAHYLPRVLGAGLLLLLAWLASTVARMLAIRLLAESKIQDSLGERTGVRLMGGSVANVLFWLVFLLFIPAVVAALGIDGLLAPVQNVVNELLGALPNIFAGAIIVLVGWLLASILRGLTSSALSALGIDRYASRLGLPDTGISGTVGLIVFVLVLVPVLIAALQALRIDAIAQPATLMLGQFLAAIPNIFAAIVILALTFVVARLISSAATRVSVSMGIDRLPAHLGVTRALPEIATPSRLVGSLVMFFAMLFATVEAANRLAFAQFATLVRKVIEFSGNVLLGALVFIVGFWLSGLVNAAIRQSGSQHSAVLAPIARIAIIGLVLAMGLRAMGIADDIVNLGFGLVLGAVAVAFALAFGLGGREAAGKQLEWWFERIRQR